MKIVLDAGALIGIDHDDRRVAGLIELGRRNGAELTTTAPVIAQAWRDGARQALLTRLMPMVDTRVVDVEAAKRAGELLVTSRTADVVDALLAQLASTGDQIFTSDPGDLALLLDARGVGVAVVAV